MRYTEEQVAEAHEWLNDPDRDWGRSDDLIIEFDILNAIVMGKSDPVQWFENLIEWVYDNIDKEEL